MVNSFDSLHVDLIQSQIQQQTGYFKFGHFFLPSALDGEQEHQQQGKILSSIISQKKYIRYSGYDFCRCIGRNNTLLILSSTNPFTNKFLRVQGYITVVMSGNTFNVFNQKKFYDDYG